MSKVLTQFKDWVNNFLAKQEPFLNNMPVCPYAREALSSGRLKILMSTGDLNLDLDLAFSQFFEDRREVVIIAPPQVKPSRELDELLDFYREKFFLNDAWILLDDPQAPEVQGLLNFNFGYGTLFIIQGLTSLVKATNELKLRGYYNNWSAEYYDLVVGRRQLYFERMLDYKQMCHHANIFNSVAD